MKKLSLDENIDFHFFDTDKKNQREVAFEVVDSILNDMKQKYILKINEEFK